MTTEEKTLSMRLAFRTEGEFVNAYFAPADTMDGAIQLGSMQKRILDASPEAWAEWRALMTKAMSVLIQSMTGVKPTWTRETPAPEHERSGNA